MKNLTSLTVLLLLMCYAVVSTVYAQPTSLPLFQIEDLDYQGAFRIPSGDFGESASDYSTGTIAYNKDNGSLFLSGHVIFGTVGEFSIPALVNSTDLTALNEASVLQNFRQILNETSNGNPQNIDEISGMAYINNRLYVNAVEWYDAPANNTHTTLIIENPSNIQNSAITGYYSLEGAAHTAGWFSPVPPEWQALIGETYLTGNSSKFSINGRLPIGITAFGFNPADIVGAPSGTIATTTLLDYSLSTPLHADYNAYDIPNFNVLTLNGDNSFAGHTVADANIVVGQNNIWTEVSQASFGMIIPGTRTYFTIGSSGGHNSGIGYKPTQSNGNQCGGPCPYDANDYYNYYWLWDTNDLIAVKNGTINPYDVRPYDYGVFNAPFQEDYITQSPEFHSIVGGTFDETNQVMYLSIYDGASTGQFAKVPVIAAYNFGTSSNCPIAGMSCDDGDPNTINDIEDGACGCSGTPLNCPVAGTSCDDGDPNTINDIEDGACGCSGTPINNPTDCQLLSNPNFDTNIDAWVYWGCTAAVNNGVVNLTNISSAVNPWDVGFIQNNQNISVQQGQEYQVNFSARADANRPMLVSVQLTEAPYTTYFSQTVNLNTSMQDFSFTFTMNSPTDTNSNFEFYLGQSTTNTYIDNASLQKTNCNNEEEPPPPPPINCDCPTPAEPGNVVSVQNVAELRNAMDQANAQNGNMTILVQAGTYTLNSNLRFINTNMEDLTIKGATGNRDDVIIKGLGWNNSAVTHIFSVAADRFTVADMTIGEVYYHPIQVQSNPNDADDFTAINLRIIDAKEQLLKVSAGGDLYADRGGVYCSVFEFTQGIAYQFYTGGIDAHRAVDWTIHNNVFKGIRSPDNTLAEHAIHMWRDCKNTIVTANKIDNCDRGIGFGLGDGADNGHFGGLIMNNFVHTNRDVGIGLEYSPDTKVYNNTVITDNYPHSIEYRFTATVNVQIANNLVSGNILLRNGASATLTTNYQVTDFSIFANASTHDYHLVDSPSSIIDMGTSFSEIVLDIDCEGRPDGAGIDIGADEKSSPSSCPPTLTLSGLTITNETYHAIQEIRSNAVIGANVMYKAGDEVELMSGFAVNPGYSFLATIEACP